MKRPKRPSEKDFYATLFESEEQAYLGFSSDLGCKRDINLYSAVAEEFDERIAS